MTNEGYDLRYRLICFSWNRNVDLELLPTIKDPSNPPKFECLKFGSERLSWSHYLSPTFEILDTDTRSLMESRYRSQLLWVKLPILVSESYIFFSLLEITICLHFLLDVGDHHELLLSADHLLIWPWLKTYGTIFEWMNIHKSQLFWCSPGVQGFDPWPYWC